MMKAAVRSAAPVLVIALLTIGGILLAGWPIENTGGFPAQALLSVLVIAVVAGARQWRSRPWLPWLGMVFAGAGHAVDSTAWMNAGFLAFGVLMLWHDYRHERPQREATLDTG